VRELATALMLLENTLIEQSLLIVQIIEGSCTKLRSYYCALTSKDDYDTCYHANRFDKITLDYGQVAEVTFWEFRFKKKIGSYTVNQFNAGYVAK